MYATNGAGEQFIEDIESGDRARALLALRRHIAERIADGIAARDLAALSRQLRDITKELEALGADADDAESAPEDELARRRAAVLSAAGVDGAAEGGDARAAGRRARR